MLSMVEHKITIPEGTPIDAKILVSADGKRWVRRHYAGMENNKHCAYVGHASSWTNDRYIESWEYMKLADE